MHFRKQYAPGAAERSAKFGTDASKGPGARQEFKQSADINNIVNKFLPHEIAMRQVQYGAEIDYDVDLMRARTILSSADNIYRDLSPDLKEKFKSPSEVMTGILSGELEEMVIERNKKAAETKAAKEKADKEAHEGGIFDRLKTALSNPPK